MWRSQMRSGSRWDTSGLCSDGQSRLFERRWTVRHVAEGVLRRLDDEPLAIPDRITDHVASCGRCSARRAQIARDTEDAALLLSSPQSVPDTDMAWARFQRELHRSLDEGADRRPRPAPAFGRRPRFPSMSLRAVLVIGAV